MPSRVILSLATLCCLLGPIPGEAAMFSGLIGKTNFSVEISPPESREVLQTVVQQAIKKHRRQLGSAEIELATAKLALRESELLRKVLQAEGYYAATLSYDIEGEFIRYVIRSGPAYRIKAVTGDDKQAGISLPTMDSLGIAVGDRLRAEDVLAARENLEGYIERNNCFWQTEVGYEVLLDHKSAEATVRYYLPQPEPVRFGIISIEGTDVTTRNFIRGKLEFFEGGCYHAAQLETTRLQLLQTGLFSQVDVTEKSPIAGSVDIQIDVKERSQRTVSAGLGYSTDQGFGVSAGWQHRNIFGGAKKLDLNAKYSAQFAGLESTLTIPSFLRPRQNLAVSADITRENLEAFDAIGLLGSAIVSRQFKHGLTASAGLEAKLKDIDEASGSETFALLALPLASNIDRRDDILNPTRGWIATAELRPVIDTRDLDTRFLRFTVSGSAYRTFDEIKYSPTLAMRARLGSIFGLRTPDIPADERFYAGGGGSVRGYPFQELGPLLNLDPVGGRSLLEISMEARFRFTGNWGAVMFMDGGNVYDEVLPQFDQKLRWAAGFGARYYTALAPIRVDVAFPLQRRSGIDDAFQIYISLAQAF